GSRHACPRSSAPQANKINTGRLARLENDLSRPQRDSATCELLNQFQYGLNNLHGLHLGERCAVSCPFAGFPFGELGPARMPRAGRTGRATLEGRPPLSAHVAFPM